MTAKGARRLLLAGTATIASIGTAHAQSTTGTVAGTNIANTASATYTVNGTAGTATSNTANFLVDRKVNLTVISTQTTPTQVNLNQTDAVTTFQVTNNTNGIQDFRLAANQVIPNGLLTGTDSYDINNLHIYVDANNNGTYEPETDKLEYIDELAPDASVAVFIVGNIPASVLGSKAQVGLDVTVAGGGAVGTPGTPLTQTLVNLDNAIDVVFADDDNDGVLGYDTLRNGQGWAYGVYEIGASSVDLRINKSATVLSDGVSLINPKALPGAIVQYCLTVTNATLLTPATGINLTDVIPANTTYVPGTITVGGLGAGGVCLVGGFLQNDDGSQALGPYNGSYNVGTKTVTATIPLLLGGTSLAASFQVKIN